MRLIDADALVNLSLTRDHWKLGMSLTRYDVDAAPTVECAACRHWESGLIPVGCAHESLRQSDDGMWVEFDPPSDSFGCALFETRQL
jgi:hypothetical protein